MVFTNICYKQGKVSEETARVFAKVLHPFAPHLAEEIWEMYGGTHSLTSEEWPAYDSGKMEDDTVTYPVSFNGKKRFELELPKSLSKVEVEQLALSDERAQKWLSGTPKKVIVVPGKIINIVV
jgi:leucyl-tRNA synthetase